MQVRWWASIGVGVVRSVVKLHFSMGGQNFEPFGGEVRAPASWMDIVTSSKLLRTTSLLCPSESFSEIDSCSNLSSELHEQLMEIGTNMSERGAICPFVGAKIAGASRLK
jgi:hypothetical protein